MSRPLRPIRARANGRPAASRCTAPSRRTSAARLGRPVTGSVRESSSSSASTPGFGAREVTSRQYRTSAPTSGSARRSRTVAWMSRHRPSAWRTRAVRTARSLLGGPVSAPSRVGASSGWTRCRASGRRWRRRVEAEQVGGRLGGEGDAQVAVEDDDGVDAALHERAERGLAARAGRRRAGADGRGRRRARRRRRRGPRRPAGHRGGARRDGQQCAQHGHDGARDRGHGEEPGAPSGGRGRVRSRRLPQDGGGRHASVIGSWCRVLQPSLPFCHPTGDAVAARSLSGGSIPLARDDPWHTLRAASVAAPARVSTGIRWAQAGCGSRATSCAWCAATSVDPPILVWTRHRTLFLARHSQRMEETHPAVRGGAAGALGHLDVVRRRVAALSSRPPCG